MGSHSIARKVLPRQEPMATPQRGGRLADAYAARVRQTDFQIPLAQDWDELASQPDDLAAQDARDCAAEDAQWAESETLAHAAGMSAAPTTSGVADRVAALEAQSALHGDTTRAATTTASAP